MKRDEIDAALLAWMGDPHWHADEARFEATALALFAHQFEHCGPYRRFCEGRGCTPAQLRDWSAIPPVPTGAFKELDLRCFPPERTLHTFRTSGTSLLRRGALHLDTLELYEASLLPSFRRFVLPDLGDADAAARLLVLAPSPAEARDSSLSHMFGVLIRELGAQGSRFFVEAGTLLVDALLSDLEAASDGPPLALCGTAFSFAHLLDELERRGERLHLPASTRIMETGGFKGRARSLPRPELYLQLEDRLGVPVERIVNQYGMTELASQFHDSVLCEPDAMRRKLGPPWARVRIVDPESGEEARNGEAGAIVVFDLGNSGSILAIQTADLGRAVDDGFEVLGREPGAEERGCSIAADELLSGARA